MKKLLFMKSSKDQCKDNCYINKQKYHQRDKIGIRNIHFTIFQPNMANDIASINVKDITPILPMSIWELVKKVAAPIPKKIWDEAIEKFDQYFVSSLIFFDLIKFTVTKIRILHNGQIHEDDIVQSLERRIEKYILQKGFLT